MGATVRKTFKCELMPTPEHERALELALARCRTRYHCALQQGKTWWEHGQGKGATHGQQKAELPDLKAARPEYAQINAQVLHDVLLRLDRALHAFFRRVAADETPGYPRFQGRGRYTSFTHPQYGGGAMLDGGLLSLSKIGRIRMRPHRPLLGTPKTVAISREADGWYAGSSCADAPKQPLSGTGRETGVDVGLKLVLITSDGEVVASPRHYRGAAKRLATAQRGISRREKRSKRRWKAARLLAKQHRKVQRLRRDFHHKTALALVHHDDTIDLEDLQVRNMARNPHLAKSIGDVSWGQFRIILACRAERAGKRVIAVPAHYTSRDCLGSGERMPTSLSVRTHVCPSCGLVLDRDENAALNTLRAGEALRR